MRQNPFFSQGGRADNWTFPEVQNVLSCRQEWSCIAATCLQGQSCKIAQSQWEARIRKPGGVPSRWSIVFYWNTNYFLYTGKIETPNHPPALPKFPGLPLSPICCPAPWSSTVFTEDLLLTHRPGMAVTLHKAHGHPWEPNVMCTWCWGFQLICEQPEFFGRL